MSAEPVKLVESSRAFAVRRGKPLMTHIDTVHAQLREAHGEATEELTSRQAPS